MNILLVNHYAGSRRHGMEYRHLYLAREWVKLGHNVTIVAASFSHLRTVQPACPDGLTSETVEGVRYVWLKTPKYMGNGLGRLLNILTFVAQLVRYRRKLARDACPNVVIASSTYRFEAYSSRWIAKKCGARLIYEVRDLWPLTQVEVGGMSRWHPFVALLQVAENYAYRHADFVVSTLAHAEPYLRLHGLRENAFAYIPNGIDVAEWQGLQGSLPEEHAKVLQSLHEQGRFVVGYAGTHGLANDLDTLLEAAAILHQSAATFVLVGQGPEKCRLERKAADLRLSNVVFLPSISKSAIPRLLDSMDALYLGWPKHGIYRYGISPNKLSDYMMAGRPILHCVEAANDPVAVADCGITCPAQDPAALARAIESMHRESTQARAAMGHRGRDYVQCHHDYTVLAKQFLTTMDESVAR